MPGNFISHTLNLTLSPPHAIIYTSSEGKHFKPERLNSMENKNVNVNFGITALLGIAFVVLKLCNVIQWSWIWVLAPFWIPVVLSIILILIFTFLSR